MHNNHLPIPLPLFIHSKKVFPVLQKHHYRALMLKSTSTPLQCATALFGGGLVPYDQIWVTVAQSATNIKASKNFVIGDAKIKAGKYALFTIPGKKEWTIILNKNYQKHLADNYKQKEDVVRIKVKTIAVENSLERLQYIIENGRLIIAWEKLRVEIPLMIE